MGRPRIHEPRVVEFLQNHGAATLRQLAALNDGKSNYAYKPIATLVEEKAIRITPLDPELGRASQFVAQLATDRSAWTLEQLQMADLALTVAQGPMPWEWIPGDPPAILQGAILMQVFAARETDSDNGRDAIARIRAYVEATGTREICYTDWDADRARAVFRALQSPRLDVHAGWASFRDRADRRQTLTHAEQIEEAYRRLDALRAGAPKTLSPL